MTTDYRNMETDYSNYFHPSFRPLLNSIPEHGMYSHWAYVVYEITEGHQHMVILGDGTQNSLLNGGTIEEAAEELVEAVDRCNEGRHDGHGYTHPEHHIEQAYKTAIVQLQTKQYDREHAQQVWLQQMYHKWGGHIPAAVVLPTDNEWKMIIPNVAGDPIMHDVNASVARQLSAEIPMPSDKNALRAPLGWSRRPRWSAKRRLRHLRKKGI